MPSHPPLRISEGGRLALLYRLLILRLRRRLRNRFDREESSLESATRGGRGARWSTACIERPAPAGSAAWWLDLLYEWLSPNAYTTAVGSAATLTRDASAAHNKKPPRLGRLIRLRIGVWYWWLRGERNHLYRTAVRWR
jgi:hypothetical protein